MQHPTLETRRNWSFKHARSHTATEHKSLLLSGRWLTPEAAYRLAAFGVIDIPGLTLDEEVSAAYAQSSPIPTDNPEEY